MQTITIFVSDNSKKSSRNEIFDFNQTVHFSNSIYVVKQATKIRQHILGHDHPVTINSLDFFTQVYAEAGADQYQGD